MKTVKAGEIVVLKFKSFEEMENVEHCFTSKIGGCSEGAFASLNMGINTEDKRDCVVENYSRVSKEVFGSEASSCVLSKQVHKTEIAIVKAEDMGNGITKEQKYSEIDGIVTADAGPILSTVYADCTPLFFADSIRGVVGVAHAGWRGTVGKIGRNMVEIMTEKYGSDISDIKVGIGPTIGPCCYEVKGDVASQFRAAFSDCSDILEATGEDVFKLNLWKANKAVALEAGILENNIEMDDHCTNCNGELFYSYRRDNGITGRMAAMIKLK